MSLLFFVVLGVAIIDDDRKVLISDLLFGFETWQVRDIIIIMYSIICLTFADSLYSFCLLTFTIYKHDKFVFMYVLVLCNALHVLCIDVYM